VLIVGPVGLLGDAIEDALRKGGHRLVDGGVVSTDEAIGTVASLQPDIVIVDIDAVGPEWRLLLRELARERNHPTLVGLAWSTDPATILDAVLSGATGYLTKDVSGPALARAIAGIERGELAMSRKVAAIALQGLSSARRTAVEVDPADPLLKRITRRESEVLRLLASGLTDREIADTLGLSIRTVESHVTSILRRMGVASRTQAALRYRAAGRTTPADASR
jgi:DNA-binding NarL/FixJ family response regulator